MPSGWQAPQKLMSKSERDETSFPVAWLSRVHTATDKLQRDAPNPPQPVSHSQPMPFNSKNDKTSESTANKTNNSIKADINFIICHRAHAQQWALFRERIVCKSTVKRWDETKTIEDFQVDLHFPRHVRSESPSSPSSPYLHRRQLTCRNSITNCF